MVATEAKHEVEKEDDTNSCTECADEEEDREVDEAVATNDLDETEVVVPSKFICPLTLDIMKDPLMSRHGQNYERKAIMEWIHQGNDTCPMTRQPLKLSGLITNHQLKQQIEQWRIENNYKVNHSSKKKKKSKFESTERILGMYCDFREETTDRSRDDPQIVLEWRRPASLDDEDTNGVNRNNHSNKFRNFLTRFRSKPNRTSATTMV